MISTDTLLVFSISCAVDAAKRKALPAWIREGLEKMEREKQKKFEKEQKKKAEEEAKLAKEQAEKEAEEEAERQSNGKARVPRKSRFVSDFISLDLDYHYQGSHFRILNSC